MIAKNLILIFALAIFYGCGEKKHSPINSSNEVKNIYAIYANSRQELLESCIKLHGDKSRIATMAIIRIKGKEYTNIYSKCKNLPAESECIDENHCFVKYEEEAK